MARTFLWGTSRFDEQSHDSVCPSSLSSSWISLGFRWPARAQPNHWVRSLRTAALLVLLTFLLRGASLGQIKIQNGDFEAVGSNGLPVGWHIGDAGEPEHEEGGTVEIRAVKGVGHSGSYAVQLHSEISSYPAFLDQDLTPQGKGPLPTKGTISFWYKVIDGTVGRLAVTVLGVGAKRDYPGGFYIPVTFADDKQWHYVEMGYDVSGDPGVSSAFVRIYVMSFEIRYHAPTKFLVDDVRFRTDEPAYFAPRLFHIIEGQDPDVCEVRVYLRNMSLRPGTARLQLILPPHLKADEGQEQKIDLPSGAAHGFFMRDPGGSGMVKWTIRGHRNAGDTLSVHMVGETAPKNWIWNRKLDPDLEVSAEFPQGLVAPGKQRQLEVSVKNNGHAYSAPGDTLQLSPSPTLATSAPLTQALPSPIGPGQTMKLHWEVTPTQEGTASADILLRPALQNSSSPRSAHIEMWADAYAERLEPETEPKSWEHVELVSSGDLFLSLGSVRDEYGPLALFYRDHDKFTRLATAPFLGRVVYLENGKEVTKEIRYRAGSQLNKDIAYLVANWQDAGNVSWKSTLEFRAAGSKQCIGVISTLESSAPREVVSFQGPLLLAGDGTTGSRKDSAQFPGIEWLENNEVSSNQSNIPGLRDQRIPHPNKITVPAMGVVVDRKMIGIMWDPLQRWDGENDRPTAIFDSPNRTYGLANHLMGLFLPSIPKWVPQYQQKANPPYVLKPETKLTLQFSIIAANNADELSPVLYWYKAHGPADPPQLDRTFDEELALSKVSANRENNVEETVLQSLPKAETALAKLGPDGWWPWSYSGTTFNTTLNFTWASNLDPYGIAGDTAIGAYSATNSGDENIELFRAARYTGDPKLVQASLRALQRAEQFTRPEGPSPWEIPLHAPDILGAPYGVSAFLEGYKLTGDKRWLNDARWWAKTGLPFVYVWGAPDQPKMKYAAIPDFGGSFLDYLLLGQSVTWTAMRYADSLIDLAHYDPEGPWKQVAQGILYNCMLQHEMTGPNAGQWPDWRDLIKNRVLVNVWYSDPRVANLLLTWEGKVGVPRTTVVKAKDKEIRITADGEVLEAGYHEGRLIVKLKPAQQSMFHVVIAGVKPFQQMISPSNAVVSFNRRYSLSLVHFEPSATAENILEVPVEPSE